MLSSTLLTALSAFSGLTAASALSLDSRGTCSTSLGSGTCQSTSSCGGFVATGACPGGSTNLCCINKSCSTSKGSGLCRNTSYGCSGGSFVSGACPGGSDIQCCVKSSNSCSTSLGSGTCQSTSSCGGFVATGACPGGSTNLCCIQQSCSTSQGTGKCRNTSYGCSGGSFVSGACPGGSDIQCCVPGGSSGGGGGGGGSGGTCPSGNLPGLDSTQSAHAAVIIAQAKSRGLGRQGCLAAIATAYVESSIRVLANNAVPESLNYPHDGIGSDHLSIGIFQQQTTYYPDVAADMDPAGSANQFFDKMVKVANWQTIDVGVLCQDVQGSAVPDAYDNKGLPIATPVCNACGF